MRTDERIYMELVAMHCTMRDILSEVRVANERTKPTFREEFAKVLDCAWRPGMKHHSDTEESLLKQELECEHCGRFDSAKSRWNEMNLCNVCFIKLVQDEDADRESRLDREEKHREENS